MAAAAFQVHRPDFAFLILLGFAFFLRTMELVLLEANHINHFPRQGMVGAAIVNAKTSKGLQQSVSLCDRRLVEVLCWIWEKEQFSGPILDGVPTCFRPSFAALVKMIHLPPANFLPYSLRRGGATEFYQRTQSLGKTMIQGRWKDATTARTYIDDARAHLVQLCLPSATLAHQSALAKFWQVASPRD